MTKTRYGSMLTQRSSGEFNLGHYSVGDEKYVYKVQALVAGSQRNLHPVWNFHDEIFGQVNWQQSSNIGLRHIYGIRARQLRERYDYLTLHFSGGADSTNALKSFIDNNIKLDEVCVRWPIRATKDVYTANTEDKSAANILSEWDYAIVPMLDYLKIHHPNIKITVLDWSDEIENLDTFPDDLIENIATEFLNFGVFVKHLQRTPEEKNRFDNGLNSASIFALDKCRLIKKDGNAYVHFLDIPCNSGGSQKNKNIEPFYWTPDLPEIVLEQAHVVYNFFKMNPHLQDLMLPESFKTPEKQKIYENIIKSLIYPDYDLTVFQAGKPWNMIYNETDTWMFKKYKNQRLIDSWEWSVKNALKAIDPKYIRYEGGAPTGFVGFISPFYKIGTF